MPFPGVQARRWLPAARSCPIIWRRALYKVDTGPPVRPSAELIPACDIRIVHDKLLEAMTVVMRAQAATMQVRPGPATELAREVRGRWPGAGVLVVSGYA